MMNFTEEHQLFRESLRDFLQAEVTPYINEWEAQGLVPRSIYKKMGEMGFLGINYPEKYGGMDLDLGYTIILLEEMQKVNSGGFAASIWAHVYLAMTHLNAEGSEKVKEDYLVPSISGDKVGCLCITEPFGGSDVSGMRTTATPKGENYVLNGSKTFITNGVYADYFVVAAKTNPDEKYKGISIFIVDKNAKGISATKLDKLGWRASDTAELAFDNVEIPAWGLMGKLNNGFGYIMQHFALERLVMAINAHARTEYALEYTREYMHERKAFGKSISEFQSLRHKLVEGYAQMELCKTYNYTVAKAMQEGQYVVKEATIAKLQSTRVADETINMCLQLLGGYGYMEEYPLARLLRDSRIGPIGGGTSEILKEILSKVIIDQKEYKKTV